MAIKCALAAAGVALAIMLVSLSSGGAKSNLQTDLALLGSMPAYPGATQTREYVRTEGRAVWRGKEYATELALPEAPTAVQEFYNERLGTAGWRAGEPQAATSNYSRGGERAVLFRHGAEPSGQIGKRIISSTPAPSNARFYFAVEVSTTAE